MEFYLRQLVEMTRPRERTLISTVTSIASGDPIFPANVFPEVSVGTLRFEVVFGGDLGQMSLTWATSHATSPVEYRARALTLLSTFEANAAYTFDATVVKTYGYNLNPGDATSVVFAKVIEIGGILA